MIPVRRDTRSIQFFPFTRVVLGPVTISTPRFTHPLGSMGEIRVVNLPMGRDSNPQVQLVPRAT